MEGVICRVCLAETGEFQTVFTSVELEERRTTMHLSEMICSFTPVQVRNIFFLQLINLVMVLWY